MQQVRVLERGKRSGMPYGRALVKDYLQKDRLQYRMGSSFLPLGFSYSWTRHPAMRLDIVSLVGLLIVGSVAIGDWLLLLSHCKERPAPVFVVLSEFVSAKINRCVIASER